MHSKVAQQSREALLDQHRTWTPEQRLAAFLTHCRLMAQLKEAGEKLRREARGDSTPRSRTICARALPAASSIAIPLERKGDKVIAITIGNADGSEQRFSRTEK
jgi:hypothetical protein